MTSLTKPKPKTYANPSWTMAIASKPSALSRWWGQSLSQVASFTLHLKASEESLTESESSEPEGDVSHEQQGSSVVIQGNQAQLEGFAQLTEQYVQSWLGRSLAGDHSDALEPPSSFWDEAPEWQSTSGYSHRLLLGALNVEPILRELKVSTTQLYDLAEILQQSVAEVQPLVASSEFARTLPVRSPSWGKTAAVAAIALGLTGGLAWVMGGESVFQTASDSDSEPDELVSLNRPQDPNPEESPINLPPAFPAQSTKPTAPAPKSKTSIAKKVTPPQLGEKTRNTDVDNAIVQQKQSQSSATKEKIETAKKANDSSKSPASQEIAKSSQSSKTPAKPSNPSDVGGGKDVRGDQPKVEAEVVPTSPKPGAKPGVKSGAKPSVKPSATLDAIAGAPAPSTAEKTLAAAPPVASEALVPQSPAQAPNPSPSPEPAVVASPNAADFSIASENSRRAPVPVSAAPVLRFFQSQWQGQDSLEQSLLYTISINSDGSVRSVTPKNEVASTRLSQTPLPSPGDVLMSPFAGASVATFEVTLYPDGTVSVK